MRVYLAGDWFNPPMELCTFLENNGHTVIDKWWIKHDSPLGNLLDKVNLCEAFVFDMRTERFGKHPLGGSHVGAGMAIALGKKIVVLSNQTMGDKPRKLYTSVLKDFHVETQEDVLSRLSN